MGFFEGNGLDFAGVDVGHAVLDFFVPGGFDGGIVRFVEAFDKGAGEVGAFGDWERKSFFQKFGSFLGHTLIVTRNTVVHGPPPKGGGPKRDFSLRCSARNDGWVLGVDSGVYANNWRWWSWGGSRRRRFLRGDNVARRALGVAGGWPITSAAWAATFSRTRSAILSTSYPLARVRISFSAAHSHSMAPSKAATLLDRSRRKLRISVVMLMMPPMQECFVPLGQNDQWNFRTMLAVRRCEFLRERAGSAPGWRLCLDLIYSFETYERSADAIPRSSGSFERWSLHHSSTFRTSEGVADAA